MSLNEEQRKRWRLMLTVQFEVLALIVIVACNRTENATTLSVVTAVPSPAPENLSTRVAPKRAPMTAFAQREAQHSTAVALTPGIKPTHRPMTPMPTATLEMGMLSSCGIRKNAREPIEHSCWRGIISGDIVEVGAGLEVSEGYEDQGLVSVHTRYQPDYNEYPTPQKVGPVRIASVNGMLFTLVPVDPNAPPITFTFDLSTRQWVSPPPLPTPSLSVPLLPTISPLSTLSPLPSVPPLPTLSPGLSPIPSVSPLP